VTFTILVAWNAVALARSDRARRGAEDAVRESEEDLATTLHSIGDAIIATDVGGRVRMNPVAEVLTGWSLGDPKGRPLAS
jgi:PAS domain-containing protein